MISVDDSYRKACESNIRKSYVYAKFGLYSKEAKANINSIIATNQPFSNLNDTINEIKKTNFNYISCEPDRVRLDSGFCFISDKTKINANEKAFYWSKEMSNSSGCFDENPSINYYFNKTMDYIELTLHFQEICKEFYVTYYKDTTKVKSIDIINNDLLIVEVRDNLNNSNLTFNRLEIEFNTTSEPFRYIKFNEVDFGSYSNFSQDDIKDYDIVQEISVDNMDIISGQMNLILNNENGQYDILNPNNNLQKLSEGQEITLYHCLYVNDGFKEVPLGTYLLKSYEVNNDELNITAYDDFYYMNDTYSGSKFYNNMSAKSIFVDVFEYFDYTNYEIEDSVDLIMLSGYIPKCEFKEALRLIAQASNCIIMKNRYGKTLIKANNKATAKNFVRKDFNSESPQMNMYDKYNINYYSYSLSNEQIEVYKNKLDKGEYEITFNEYPIDISTFEVGLTKSGYTLSETNATSCKIKIINDNTELVLRAKVYNQSVTNYVPANVPKNSYTNTIDNTLITEVNYMNVYNKISNRGKFKFVFDTKVMPYIEVGDSCTYYTKYNQTFNFMPTKIEYTKSILQTFEGE